MIDFNISLGKTGNWNRKGVCYEDENEFGERERGIYMGEGNDTCLKAGCWWILGKTNWVGSVVSPMDDVVGDSSELESYLPFIFFLLIYKEEEISF